MMIIIKVVRYDGCLSYAGNRKLFRLIHTLLPRAPRSIINYLSEEKLDCKMNYSDIVVWPEVARNFYLPSLRRLSSLFKVWRCSLTSKLWSSLLPPGDTLSISRESVYLNEKRYNPQSRREGENVFLHIISGRCISDIKLGSSIYAT